MTWTTRFFHWLLVCLLAGRELRTLKLRPDWKQVVEAVEAVKGERWERFRDRIGDWGLDVALLLGRREGGLKLGQLG